MNKWVKRILESIIILVPASTSLAYNLKAGLTLTIWFTVLFMGLGIGLPIVFLIGFLVRIAKEKEKKEIEEG